MGNNINIDFKKIKSLYLRKCKYKGEEAYISWHCPIMGYTYIKSKSLDEKYKNDANYQEYGFEVNMAEIILMSE